MNLIDSVSCGVAVSCFKYTTLSLFIESHRLCLNALKRLYLYTAAADVAVDVKCLADFITRPHGQPSPRNPTPGIVDQSAAVEH